MNSTIKNVSLYISDKKNDLIKKGEKKLYEITHKEVRFDILSKRKVSVSQLKREKQENFHQRFS
jgi:hypothetical protein